MKVICKCETVIEMTIVGGQYQHTFEGTCSTCKTMWQLVDVISESDERLENIPAECEDTECKHCPLYYDKMGRKQIGCPYVD